MSLRIYDDVIQRTDEWYEARRGIVTASTAGNLITAKTIKPADNATSRGLVAQLVAERITGHVEPTFLTEDMIRGMEDEPRARAVYAKHHRVSVVETGFMVREEDDWSLGYSPDGLVGDDGLIEIKSRKPKIHLAHLLAGVVPPEHMAQIQTGLLVSGRAWCDYVSYSGGMPMWTVRVEPEEQWQDALVEAVTTFEKTAAAMVERYHALTAGLPMTERTEHVEVVI